MIARRFGGRKVRTPVPRKRDKAAVVKMTGYTRNGHKFPIVICDWPIAKPRESATESKQPTSKFIWEGNGETVSRCL